jgi:hypothetical protein
MPGATIRGVVGKITWSYYTAAAINGYTVTRSKAGAWTLRATVVASDAFKLRQTPLRFVAPHKTGSWVWPVESCEMVNSVLTARLGAPVE